MFAISGLILIFLSIIIWTTNDHLALILRITIGLPLVWLAWVCQRIIFQNKRIREEYFHKASMMDTYVGFKNEMKETEMAERFRLDFLNIVLKAIANNPAITMHKRNDFIKGNNPLNVIEKSNKKIDE